MSDDAKNLNDVDALLAEAGLVEPDPVTLRWRGKDWQLKPVGAVDPRLTAKLRTVEQADACLREALGPKQYKAFPMPRTILLPDGRTEIGLFLDAWLSASNEGADVGESQPSPSS